MAFAGDRIRVLFIVQNLPVPFDRRVWLEATTLARAGYSVSVICPKAKEFRASREVLEDVHIYRYALPLDARTPAGFVVEFLWCFCRTLMLSVRIALTGRGFDILHVCNPPEIYWPLGWFWRLFGKKFIFDHHDLSPEMFAVKFGAGRTSLYRGLLFLERRTFNVADVVIAPNESHKEIAVTRGLRSPDDVFVVRSGPALSRLRRFAPDPAWRNGKRHLLVYLGEICKQDGVDHLVRALALLRDEMKRSDFHCVFVGGGPHQPAIVRYAGEQGIDDICTFVGRVSDDVLCRILSSGDIAIDPDPKNEWSDKSTMNKVVEYMHFGLPIVSYDLHETRVSAGSAALYVTANSEPAMAAGIDELLNDPERRRSMGAFGVRRVREALAWDYSAASLLEAYRRVAAGRSKVASGRDQRAQSPSADDHSPGDEAALARAQQRSPH
jgi:glycosyltransferase involved in cell wall biosynthesis